MGMELSAACASPSTNRVLAAVTSHWARITGEHRNLPEDFARHLREIARPTQIAYTRLMRHSAGYPVGVECANKDRTLWAVVLPNVKTVPNPQDWRIQVFDTRGFCSHHCHASLQEAVEAMLASGYQSIDAGALDRLAATSEWALGCRAQELRDLHSRGRLPFAEMCARLRELQPPEAAMAH